AGAARAASGGPRGREKGVRGVSETSVSYTWRGERAGAPKTRNAILTPFSPPPMPPPVALTPAADRPPPPPLSPPLPESLKLPDPGDLDAAELAVEIPAGEQQRGGPAVRAAVRVSGQVPLGHQDA